MANRSCTFKKYADGKWQKVRAAEITAVVRFSPDAGRVLVLHPAFTGPRWFTRSHSTKTWFFMFAKGSEFIGMVLTGPLPVPVPDIPLPF